MSKEDEGHFCPQCGTKLVPIYSKEEDCRATTNPISGNIHVQMRCTKCVINITISIDPKDLEEEQPPL